MEISIAHPYGNAPEKPTPSKAIMERAEQEPTSFFTLEGERNPIGLIRYDEDNLLVHRDSHGNIDYICVVATFRQSNLRQVFVQKNVWQLPNCARGFARKVMLHFCTGGRILASDERQRKKGAIMWRKFLAEDCGDKYAYVQHANGLSGLTPHTKSMLIAFAYAGNADSKIFVVSDQPITDIVRAKW